MNNQIRSPNPLLMSKDVPQFTPPWMVFRSFTGVKSGALRAYNICLASLLPIPAKTMELASWVSCHHKVHTCTHSLYFMNVYIPELPGISLTLLPTTLTHFPVSLQICFLTEQLVISLLLGSRRRPGFLGCQKSLAEGVPTSCGFHPKPFTPPSGYPEMFHGRSARPK